MCLFVFPSTYLLNYQQQGSNFLFLLTSWLSPFAFLALFPCWFQYLIYFRGIASLAQSPLFPSLDNLHSIPLFTLLSLSLSISCFSLQPRVRSRTNQRYVLCTCILKIKTAPRFVSVFFTTLLLQQRRTPPSTRRIATAATVENFCFAVGVCSFVGGAAQHNVEPFIYPHFFYGWAERGGDNTPRATRTAARAEWKCPHHIVCEIIRAAAEEAGETSGNC